ncbi:MAG: hypothetical protein ABW199_09065 [Caulobacterales bacterium]
MRFRAFLAMLAALALCGGTSALAQVPAGYARQLAQQLAVAEQHYTQQGYVRMAGPFAGGLAEAGLRDIPVTLRADQDYRIIAVCDADCGDLDLRIIDPSGEVIAADVQRDDYPILRVRPRQTGAFNVEVKMYQCASAPCYFAMNVYGR